MKKILFPAALAMLIIECARQAFTVGNKPTAVIPKETITHHFFVSGIEQERTVDTTKICGGVKNVVKTETQQTFVNGLLGFITFGIYIPLGARVYCSQWLPVGMGSSSALFINILLSSLRLFLHGGKPLSGGGDNPIQRCLPVGGTVLPTPEAVIASYKDK